MSKTKHPNNGQGARPAPTAAQIAGMLRDLTRQRDQYRTHVVLLRGVVEQVDLLPICPLCGRPKEEGHAPECSVKNVLAVTEGDFDDDIIAVHLHCDKPIPQETVDALKAMIVMAVKAAKAGELDKLLSEDEEGKA